MGKFVIHGVHRSGTSFTASLMNSAGLDFSESDYIMGVQEDNPKGFWERTDVVDLNDRLLMKHGLSWFTYHVGPLSVDNSVFSKFESELDTVSQRLENFSSWFVKDPRLSLTWPYWKEFLQVDAHILVHRHPMEVAVSLNKRNGISIESGQIFWFHQMLSIANLLKDEASIHQLYFNGSSTDFELYRKTLNSAFAKAGFDSRISESMVEGMYDQMLDRSGSHHQDRVLLYPQIQQAWEFALSGDLQSIASLPPIGLVDLSQSRLDTIDSIKIESQRRLREKYQFESEINRLSAQLVLKNEELKELEKERTRQETNFESKIQQMTESFESIADHMSEYKYSMFFLLSQLPSKLISLVGRNNDSRVHKSLAIAEYWDSRDSALRKQPSSRTLLLRAIIKNPIRFLRRLSIKRVSKAILILLGIRKSNDVGIKQALTQYANADLGLANKLEIYDVEAKGEWLKGPQSIEKANQPDISICIPVFNNLDMTLSCLMSISSSLNNENPSVEVIIADDCSTEDLSDIEVYFPGVKLIRSPQNLGFLENCNHALKEARGEFVVLLNNDTNVQNGWLRALLKPFKTDEQVGITGPQFLYPDGRLQEAGGIIFSDASGWNYGRLDSPNKPEYRFSREVDYVSGACLMFKRSFWGMVGGFDTRFKPAYYEDTDLCFSAREHGLTVNYVPAAKVVHFEGVSHGSDESSGIKRYQVINKEKFHNKWEKTLATKHYPSSEFLFQARAHGINRKTLLFIDHYVPFYDKDAGSKVAFRYIELMVEQGIKVIFLGDNFYPHQPYTSELESMGVEVLIGEYYKNNWYDWYLENHRSIDTVYLNRPHISKNYIDKILKVETPPRVVYHGADLHYLRVQRQLELGLKLDGDLEPDEWKELEFDIMKKCDLSLWLSDAEVDEVKKADPKINVDFKPMYWFEKEELNLDESFTSKPNLLFVGGFGHPPNLDGFNWFLDNIFPQILEVLPDAVLTVIGSNCPDELLAKTNKNLNILGFVSEAELIEAYSRTRVAVVPLRFGAGVKGKVIESMKYGVPVVTTSIGAEGLPGHEVEYMSVADNESEFAQRTIQLLTSDSKSHEQRRNANDALSKHFSKNSALEALDKICPGYR